MEPIRGRQDWVFGHGFASAAKKEIDCAKRAIKGFLNKGLGFKFDPNDHEQCTEYLQLRQCNERVTAEALMWSLRNKTTTVDSRASTRFEYDQVPKANFPNGLPPDIKGSELGEGDLTYICSVLAVGASTPRTTTSLIAK